MNIEKIEELSRNNKTESAAKELEANFQILSKDHRTYTLAIDLFRSLNVPFKSLHYSKELFERFPSFFDAYARYSQELYANKEYEESLRVAKLGLAKFPKNHWILIAALMASKAKQDYNSAIKFGNYLIEVEPSFKQTYRPLSECYRRLQDLESALKVLLKGLQQVNITIAYLEAILDLYLLRSDYNGYSQFLFLSASKYPQHADYISKRLLWLGNFYPPQRSASSRQANNCDVICIASDESLYIAEFIHHYLFLGFSNIYVGINNCTDCTADILRAISSTHSNVIIIDVDMVQGKFKQIGCYSHLFQYAKSTSNSQYCLFVDVDEFWVADRFPCDVNSFLEKNAPFDVFSFQWINQFNEQTFSAPLSSECVYQRNFHVKSMCSYDAPIFLMRCHAPMLIHDNNIVIKQGDQINKYYTVERDRNIINIEEVIRDKQFIESKARNLAWIFHRIERSELEYCLRLFKIHANADPNTTFFKNNRFGFATVNQSDALQQSFFDEILPSEKVKSYHNSLLSFVDNCGINVFHLSRPDTLSEQLIYSKIKQIPNQVMEDNRQLLCRIFSGTRFLPMFKDKHA